MKREKVVFSMIFLIVIIISCGKTEKASIERPEPIQDVKLVTVKFFPVEEDYEAVGTVRSKTTSILSSKMVGHIIAVHVREGNIVRIGQLLIEMDDREPLAQLEKAQAAFREVNHGQEEIEQNIRAAEAVREAAEAGRSLAQVTFNRYKFLLEEMSVSQQEFDEVRTKLKISEAELDRANRMLQALLAKKSQLIAKMEQVKADIIKAQVYVGDSRITSPINGIVTSKQAEIGLLAAPGVPLLTIEDNSRYRLEASVQESMLGRIRVGTPARVTIDALGPQEFPCKVSEVVPASDPGSRSSIVKINLSDQKGMLRSGLYGKARFPVGRKEMILIPRTAIVHHGQLVSVFIVDSSNTLRLRLIKAGEQRGDQFEVLSGLKEGDRIVAEGTERVREGSRIKELL